MNFVIENFEKDIPFLGHNDLKGFTFCLNCPMFFTEQDTEMEGQELF